MGVKVRQNIPGSGVFWIFVDHKGRRTSRRVGTEKAARKAAEQIQAKLTLGHEFITEKKPPVPTVEAYWNRFESTYLRSAVALSTAASYRKNFRTHILPTFGAKPLDRVTAPDVECFIADLVDEKKLAKATIQTILRQFCRLFNRARKTQARQRESSDRLERSIQSGSDTTRRNRPGQPRGDSYFPRRGPGMCAAALHSLPFCHSHGTPGRRAGRASVGRY